MENNRPIKKAWLVLDDGTRFEGESFGYERGTRGEVVFNTAMTGYPESLTDPSYAGQIMVLTYPLVGNYGVPENTFANNGIPVNMESGKIHPKALVVADYSEAFSHWKACESLADWLMRERIPAVTGIDTRALTKRLREHGVMQGRIEIEGCDNMPDDGADYGDINHVDLVSTDNITIYAADRAKDYPVDTDPAVIDSTKTDTKRVILVDCGVKANIIRCLLSRGLEVVRVPWDYDFSGLAYDGVFISNGPGDPDTCETAALNIRKAFKDPDMPIFGICMGNQMLAKAAGADIYKLKYGHRSHNQPVRMAGSEKCFITSQNHGYAVDSSSLSDDWEPWFVNMNDGSNEGIRHKSNPWFSVQFHPEADGGPTDTEFLFDIFAEKVTGK